MLTEHTHDLLRTVGRKCAIRAATRWGVGFRRLSDDQRRAEVAREICALLFEGPSHARADALRDHPELRAMFEAGLDGLSQQVIHDSAVSAREATWGLS